MGLKMSIGNWAGNWGENFKIGRWDWGYENRHWANAGQEGELAVNVAEKDTPAWTAACNKKPPRHFTQPVMPSIELTRPAHARYSHREAVMCRD